MRRGSPVGAPADEFSAAIANHHRSLARLAYALCGDEHRAEDAVAEAYAKVWSRWQRGDVTDLHAYLRRAVINQTYGGLRRRLLERRESERRQAQRDVGQPFDRRVDDHDLLWHALAALPQSQRSVVVLRIVEDLSEDETARALGIPPGTVKSRLARALASLRPLVEDHRA